MPSSSTIKHLLVIGLFFLLSCKNKTTDQKETPKPTDTTQTPNPTKAEPTASDLPTPHAEETQTDYSFGPTVSISGTITTEMFYGAPGYGENPKTDHQEHPHLVVLDQAINVIASPEQIKEETEETKTGVRKIQLIWPDNIDIPGYLGKRLKLTGTFFGAQTGHHHTEVMMEVTAVTEL